MTVAGLRKRLMGAGMLACLSCLPALSAGGALAGPALLLDAASGRVLYEEQAGDPWYPASVTKLMTAYLVLKEVRDGRLSLDTPIKVSATAARTPPSKMGFKPGTVLTVDNALKMMLVKSANDLAVVLAEAVAGSEAAFAAAMNAEAGRLGMHGSYFVNPHGLPDSRQRVTARDLGLLARAILSDFPQFRPYFGIGGVQLGKKTYQNTNGLIGRYPGADGMKTGFICSSGFNVVATARQGGRQLIVVLLGERTATARTIRAAELFDRGFAGPRSGSRQVEDIPPGAVAFAPDLREEVCGKNRNNLADDDNAPVHAGVAGDDSAIGFLTGATRRSGTRMEGEKPGTLIKRAAIEPIPVFIGPAPGSKPAVQQAAPAAPASVQAFAATEAAAAVAPGAAPIALQGAIKQGKAQPARAAAMPLPPPRP